MVALSECRLHARRPLLASLTPLSQNVQRGDGTRRGRGGGAQGAKAGRAAVAAADDGAEDPWLEAKGWSAKGQSARESCFGSYLKGLWHCVSSRFEVKASLQ